MTEMTRLGTHPAPHRDQPVDDLKRINGIGPAIERRLNANGIFTYAQLAGSSLDELAGLFADVPGHSAERLAEKDWIGQARALQVKAGIPAIPDGPENDELDFHNRQRYASFTVELLVDAQRNIRRTRVYNIQAQRETSWAGWDPTRLASFFAESGGLELMESHTTEPAVHQKNAVAEQARPEAMPASRHPSGGLTLVDAVLWGPESRHPTRSLEADRPFQVHLDIEWNANGGELPAVAAAEYTATVDAKRIGSGEMIRLGSAHGTLAVSPRFAIDVDSAGLPAGFYRPDAFVSLVVPAGDASQRKTFRAVREGQSFAVS